MPASGCNGARHAVRLLGEIGPGAKDVVPALLKSASSDLSDAEFNLLVEALARIDPETAREIPRSLKEFLDLGPESRIGRALHVARGCSNLRVSASTGCPT